jgi:ribonuclease HI
VTPSDPQPTTGNVLYVFTDGGAYHNGYADCVASWACFITDGTTLCIASARVQPCDLGQVYKTSNQRGELSAILHALNYVESADVFVYTHIMVVSDSKYSIDCIESWAPKWRAKAGVVRGQPVVDKAAFSKYKNTDLIFPALEVTARLRTKYKVEFKHQLAHQTAVPTDPMLCFLHKGNQIVDGACSLLLPQ